MLHKDCRLPKSSCLSFKVKPLPLRMAKRWIRLYTKSYRAPKLARLQDHLFRFLVNCWCICGETDTEVLPSAEDIAFHLHIELDLVKSYLKHLETNGYLDRNEEGYLTPHDWEEHQYESDSSTDRVRKYRERKKEKQCNGGETFLKRSDSVSVSESVSVSGSSFRKESVRENPFDAASTFEEAWVYCWRKVDKATALKAYRKKATTESEARRIIGAIKAHAPFYCLRAPEHRPHLATWLNHERYNEAFDESPPQFHYNGALPTEAGMADRRTKKQIARDQFDLMLDARERTKH